MTTFRSLSFQSLSFRSVLGAAALSLGVGLLANPAFADDEDDVLDDILGSGDDDEIEDLRSGNIGDRVGARDEDLLDVAEERDRRRRVIKTIQQKNFLKLGRVEISPHAAFVSNDPFLNRFIGGIGIGYHLTEIFAIEAMIDFSPDLGQADWKPLTEQLVNENEVSPDISKLGVFGSACFVFSPIYGKAAISGRNIINFDIYGKFGMGATGTNDDLEALQKEDEASAIATQSQIHPTTNFGGGVRIVFNENFAVRVEGRSMIYIETIDSEVLEMKNNFIIQAGASFFIPNMKS